MDKIQSVEVWRDVEWYENYEISNTGKIRNKLNGNILEQNLKKHGSYVVTLYKNGKKNILLVHRLLEIAFIENQIQSVEMWRDFDGFDNYEISNTGKIREKIRSV